MCPSFYAKKSEFKIRNKIQQRIQVIIHELLHTLGFSHHHSRSDRDQYINVHLENVNANQAFNFNKTIDFDPRIKYLTPFDFKSIMLYREFEFSINNKSVITPKIDGVKIDPAEIALTKYDRILLNRFYTCYSVDNKKSKIFYQSEIGIHFPPVINYHEIARSREYLVLTDDYENGQNQKTDEEIHDQHFTNEEERVTESELVRNETIGQNERTENDEEDLVDNEENKNYENEDNRKIDEELPDQHLIDEKGRVTESELLRDKNDQKNGEYQTTNFLMLHDKTFYRNIN